MQVRPQPRDEDRERWHVTGLRHRLMTGEHRADVDERVALEVGTVRRDAWGYSDLGSNLLLSAAQAQATLYDRPATVHRARGRAGDLQSVLDEAGWQSVNQRLLRDLMAAREMHLHAERIPDGSVRLHPIWPDCVEAETGDDPERPAMLRWLHQRWVQYSASDKPKLIWAWHHWDIRGRAMYRIEDDRGQDISQIVNPALPAGGYGPDDYPWVIDGRPYIPVATYHAQRTGHLYDYRTGTELAEATLTLSVLWTMFGHVVRNASWPQRYMLNAELKAINQLGVSEDTGRRGVVADPAVVLELVQSQDVAGSPSVGSWELAADPKLLAEAIGLYERRVIALSGLNPADVSRQSGDPRSGYALAVTHEAQREAQRRYAPQMQRGDVELCRIVAHLTGLPTDGWSVSYEALPPTPAEMRERREHVFALMDRGLMSRVEAYQELYPGTSPEEAAAALAAIAATEEVTRVRPEPAEPDADDESDADDDQ